jgi:hypothetical protein
MSGVFLKSLDQLRGIEWARSWTWDVQFEDAGISAPFSKWFPATEVEEGLFNLEAFPITGGFGTFEVPKSWTLLSLQITFVDSAYLVLEQWLEKWVRTTIFGDGTHVKCLADCVKKVNIAKLDNKREMVCLNSYLVFPVGPLNFSGNSSADITSHQVEFRIVKELSKKYLKD